MVRTLPPRNAGDLDSVELELRRGARHGQLADTGQNLADTTGIVVKGGPLLPQGVDAWVVVLDDDLVDASARPAPDPWRRPAAGRLFSVETLCELVELFADAKAQHKAQLVPVHLTSF